MQVFWQVGVDARHQVEYGHVTAHEAAGQPPPLRARRCVEMVDETRLGVEGCIVGVRSRIGFGECAQRSKIGLPRDAVLERGEDGEIALGRFGGNLDDVRCERCRGVGKRRACRPASADFCKCVDQPGRQVAVLRIDTGEPVPIVMPRLVAGPAQRQFKCQVQPLSLAR